MLASISKCHRIFANIWQCRFSNVCWYLILLVLAGLLPVWEIESTVAMTSTRSEGLVVLIRKKGSHLHVLHFVTFCHLVLHFEIKDQWKEPNSYRISASIFCIVQMHSNLEWSTVNEDGVVGHWQGWGAFYRLWVIPIQRRIILVTVHT